MAKADDLPAFRPQFGRPRKNALGTPKNAFRNAILANVRAGSRLARSLQPAKIRVVVRAPTSLSRRVVLKARVVRMNASGLKGAALHLRYIQREGVERDGSKGNLYGADGPASATAFEQPVAGERHQFRFILSPEDGDELDMPSYVRRFMAQAEKDLGRRLDWAAVNHHDTDNPHAHIVIRGVDLDGRTVRFDRQYISNGLRARAQELATLELGPRSQIDIQRVRGREVHQDRFTSLDRDLERRAVDGAVTLRSPANTPRSFADATLLTARLQHLADLRLAERVSHTSWRLAPDWSVQLRELGTRGDIIKQMHAALHGDPARYRVLDTPPTATPHPPPPRYGRVAQKGLSDELRGSFYAVIETADGNGYHVPLSDRSAQQLRPGDFVAFSPAPADSPPPVPGRPTPTPRAIVRHLPMPLDHQVHHNGPAWLDHVDARSLAPYGLGAALRQHMEDRHAYLRKLGIDPDDPRRRTALQELERKAVGEAVAARRGQTFVPATPDGFRGRLAPPVHGADGSVYAVVSDGARVVVLAVSPDARQRNGQAVAVERDASSNLCVRAVNKDRDIAR
jgi:type IV secretory pathway VirD2 relaxase